MEKLSIGPSGVICKLKQIEMAVEWLEMEVEEGPDEDVVMAKAKKVKGTISILSTPLPKEKKSKIARV